MAKKKEEEKKKKKTSSRKTKAKSKAKPKKTAKRKTATTSKSKTSTKAKTVKKTEAKKTSSKKPATQTAKPKEEFKITSVSGNRKVIRWKAPDYYSFEKGPLWSLGVGVIATGASMILIYTGNFLPVIVIILAVIVSFQLSHEKPKTVEFALDEGGVISRNEYFPYREFKSFWIASHGRRKILYLDTASPLKGPVMMPLGNKSANEIKIFLLAFLPEKMAYGELLSDKLIRIFKL